MKVSWLLLVSLIILVGWLFFALHSSGDAKNAEIAIRNVKAMVSSDASEGDS
jgi:hypothetical protein